MRHMHFDELAIPVPSALPCTSRRVAREIRRTNSNTTLFYRCPTGVILGKSQGCILLERTIETQTVSGTQVFRSVLKRPLSTVIGVDRFIQAEGTWGRDVQGSAIILVQGTFRGEVGSKTNRAETSLGCGSRWGSRIW